MPPKPAECDCPVLGTASAYGNSIRWDGQKFVCGRTGLSPRGSSHGDMLSGADLYVGILSKGGWK